MIFAGWCGVEFAGIGVWAGGGWSKWSFGFEERLESMRKFHILRFLAYSFVIGWLGFLKIPDGNRFD